PSTRWHRLLPVALVAVWVAAAAITGPIGDFPLDDDWAMGRSVRNLLTTGEMAAFWVQASMIVHVATGALASLPAGFSFTALRLSTLVVAAAGIVGVYRLVRDAGVRAVPAAVAAAVVAANPIYFNLSFTFMTDVPFVAWSVWSLVYMFRALR